MRSLIGLMCALALGAAGCDETTGTGGSGGNGGISGDANCAVYCEKVDECYRIELSSCLEQCADESAAEADVSPACADAASVQRACVGELDCEGVALWGYRYPEGSFPCIAEFSVVEALCDSTCENVGDCADERECSAELCLEGRCYQDLSNCPCEAPLSDYCADTECPTWDEAVAAAKTCDPHWRAEAGQCGDFRYIKTYWGLDDSLRYFDSSGALVGRVGCTDCNCIECGPGHDAFCIHYGEVPSCELELGEILCEEPW